MRKIIISTITALALILAGLLFFKLTDDNSMPFLNDDEIIEGKELNKNVEEDFQNEEESDLESQVDAKIEEDNSENESQFDQETDEDSSHGHNNVELENDDDPDDAYDPEEHED